MQDMKTILITLLLACCMQIAAKEITIYTKDVQRFEGVSGKHYIVVGGVRYQLHTEGQAKAVKSLVYVKEVIVINVKQSR